MKVFLDGGMLNGTAYMREPWGVGPRPTRSPSRTTAACCSSSPISWRSIAEEAARRGWQMTAHCAGEAGMDVLLTAYEHADRLVGIRGRRWLITHANFTSADEPRALRRAGRRRRPAAGLAVEGRADALGRCSARGGWSGSTPTQVAATPA